jgi:hypothetical protein
VGAQHPVLGPGLVQGPYFENPLNLLAPTYYLNFNSSLLEAKIHDPQRPQPPLVCARKAIVEFSPKSRNRLKRLVVSLETPPSHFITLTYHHVVTARESKKHLERFRKRFEAQFPKGWAIWKIEPQCKRGFRGLGFVPHYHLLAWAPGITDRALQAWISTIWWECCGKFSDEHRRAGTNVRLVQGRDVINKYLSKYFGKVQDLPDIEGLWKDPGRFWGKIGKANLILQEMKTCVLSADEYHQVKRLVRRWLKSKGCRGYSRALRKLHRYFVLCPEELIHSTLAFVKGSPEIFIV